MEAQRFDEVAEMRLSYSYYLFLASFGVCALLVKRPINDNYVTEKNTMPRMYKPRTGVSRGGVPMNPGRLIQGPIETTGHPG